MAEDTKMAICKACEVEVSLGANLVQHLKMKHAENYSKYIELKEANSEGKAMELQLLHSYIGQDCGTLQGLGHKQFESEDDTYKGRRDDCH